MDNQFDEAWARRELKKSPIDAIVDIGDPNECEPGVEDGVQPAPYVQPLVLALVDPLVDEWIRCKVSLPNSAEHKIIMDHCSSSDGKQRGYVNCRKPGHRNCFRKDVCEHYIDREHFVASLFAWALGPDGPLSRDEHRLFRPDEGRVEQVRSHMTMVDF